MKIINYTAALLLATALMVNIPLNAQMGPGMGPGNGMGPAMDERPAMGPQMRGDDWDDDTGYRMNRNAPQKRWDRKKAGKGIRIPPEMETEVISTIEKYDPSFAKKLKELREKDARKYRRTLRLAFGMINQARDLNDSSIEKDIVKAVSLEYDVRELALKYIDANDSEKAKIKSEMKEKLSVIFDTREKFRELKIKRMETKIKELKKLLEERKSNKEKIIEDRINQLTGKGIMNRW